MKQQNEKNFSLLTWSMLALLLAIMLVAPLMHDHSHQLVDPDCPVYQLELFMMSAFVFAVILLSTNYLQNEQFLKITTLQIKPDNFVILRGMRAPPSL